MRKDQWNNTVTIDGKPLGTWDTMAGGNVESTETKYRPGGMAQEVTLGGHRSVGNLTLNRLLDREDWPYMKLLMSQRVGKADVVVARQPLDVDGNPFGSPLIYRGKLQNVHPGDTDSGSAEAQTWEIIVSTDGSIA